MNPIHPKRVVGGIVCCLIVLAAWVWSRRYTYVQIHQSGHVQNLRENRLTGTIAFFNKETERWDYLEESKQEPATSNVNDIALTTGFVADVPDHQAEKVFRYAAQLHEDCLVAEAIVRSDPESRQFTREDFQSAERCVAYVTGALDALPGKVEMIGGKQYEFAFGSQKVIVGNAVDSFNRYMSAHPEAADRSGVETLERALVNERVANWIEFPVAQPMMSTKTANEQTVLSEPRR
jgi:hypothetical protein